jgi:hypothetical protein
LGTILSRRAAISAGLPRVIMDVCQDSAIWDQEQAGIGLGLQEAAVEAKGAIEQNIRIVYFTFIVHLLHPPLLFISPKSSLSCTRIF